MGVPFDVVTHICYKAMSDTSELRLTLVEFDFHTAVTMKNIIFWSVTPCSLVEVTDYSEEYIASIFSDEK
jgi:hypothetical protein